MSKYRFERLSELRIVDLHKLFISAGKKRVSYDKFKGKYNTDFAGISNIAFIVYDECSVPVAFYGLLPHIAMIDGKKVLIAQAADALTHPNHYRKGLFAELVNRTNELAIKEGINFIYGVPNEKSYTGFIKKFNWTHYGNMRIFEQKVMIFPISYFFRLNNVLLSIYNVWVAFILSLYKKGDSCLLNQNISADTFGINRDESFYKYKTYTKKHFIRLNNRTVWFKIDGALKVGDIERCSSIELKKIIQKLKIISFLLGIMKIQFQFSSNSSQIENFGKVLKNEQGLPVIFLDISNKYDFKNFVISLGDIDTF